MIDFLLKIKLLCKCKTFPTSNGMTYVELIVVLSIFSVLSSVAIFNYGGFQDMVDIRNLASDISLKIVEAQKSSIDGKWNSGALGDWKPAYGVYFNSSPTLDDIDNIYLNKKFIYFTDLNNDINYDGQPSCTPAECLDKIIITKNNQISRIEKCIDSTCASPIPIVSLSVTFQRPDSGANFSSIPNYTFTGSEYIRITISSLGGEAEAFIKIYPSGRVQVN